MKEKERKEREKRKGGERLKERGKRKGERRKKRPNAGIKPAYTVKYCQYTMALPPPGLIKAVARQFGG